MAPEFRARVVGVSKSIAASYLALPEWSDNADIDRLSRRVLNAPPSDPVFDELARRAYPVAESAASLTADADLRQVLLALWPGMAAIPAAELAAPRSS